MRRSIFFSVALTLFAATAAAQSVQPASALPIAPNAGPASWNYGPYSYDAAGNIIAIGTQSYVYDPIGRLVKGSAALTPGQQSNQVHAYTYDAYGNLTASGPEGAPTPFSVSSATNRLNDLTYDTAGNVTVWQPAGSAYPRTYTYDELNMLIQEQVAGNNDVTYHIYTPDDERYWTYRDRSGTVVSHFTLRDLGGKVLRDFQFTGASTWTVFRDYVYREGVVLASISPAGTQHVSVDHLGTPRLYTDDNRTIIGAHAYFPFGGEYSTGAQEGDVLKFTGHERDASFVTTESNSLDYMHARFYSASLGRFASVDPVGGIDTQPQSWNRYSYTINNPVNLIDPDGRFWTWYAAFDFGYLMTAGATSEVITVVARDPLRQAREAAAQDSAFREAELLAMADAASDAFSGNHGRSSPFLRGWDHAAATVWQRFGEFNTPRSGLDVAMMMFPWGKAGRVLTPSWKHAIRVLGKKGLDARRAKAAIHKLKKSEGRGGLDNVLFDTETGDVISRETGDIIGNLFDDFF